MDDWEGKVFELGKYYLLISALLAPLRYAFEI
jgi:hypothetical protein